MKPCVPRSVGDSGRQQATSGFIARAWSKDTVQERAKRQHAITIRTNMHPVEVAPRRYLELPDKPGPLQSMVHIPSSSGTMNAYSIPVLR
jgi:hypothetical protein